MTLLPDPADEASAAEPDGLWTVAGRSLERSSQGLTRGVSRVAVTVAAIAVAILLVVLVGLLVPDPDRHAAARPFPQGAEVAEIGMTSDLVPVPFVVLVPVDGDVSTLWVEAIRHYEALGWSPKAAVPRWTLYETDGSDGYWVAGRGDEGGDGRLNMRLYVDGTGNEVGPRIYLEVSE